MEIAATSHNVDHEALKGDFHAENREGVLLL
jgi:hypothetical protein